ncbi:uncharacterized protein JCM15063_005157 [Sporobolomyces koalae]|uniref:uncharacterized protein n=1 Tax=Sporobolomyces koalae TaxID=500713 RepID=UPI00317B3150
MFAKSLTVSAAVSILAATATSAQSLGSLGDISSSCQAAAVTLLGSDFATCSNLQALLGVATSSSGSIVQPVNSWLSGLCTQGNCSSATIQNATSTIDTGCASDISSGNAIVTAIRSTIENFNSDKEAVCLRSTSNNTYCLTSLLNEIQNATNTQLSLSSITSLNLNALEQVSPSTVCTDCNSGLLYKFVQSGSLNQTEVSEVQKFCNNNSFGTSLPEGVSSSSSNSSSSGSGANGSSNGGSGSSSSGKTSGAISLSVGKIAAVGLAGLVGAVLLA